MTRRPTADELGEMLEKGEISREEAVEIMAQRAREEAFGSMGRDLASVAGSLPSGPLRSEATGPSRDLVLTVVVIVGGLAAALGVMAWVIYRAFASAP